MTEQPFVVRRTFANGHASYVLLMDDKYWHCSEWEFEMIMDKGHHPEDIGMIGSDSEDE